MEKLSVVIITFNEERNIGRCIDSVVGLADDIVVVDSYSTDNTENICSEKKVRFIKHHFEGHIEQKNYAITQAKFSLVLSLDADEALSDELKKAILKVKNNRNHDGYSMNRLTNYCGHWVRFCGWYPDKKLRLWDSTKGAWGGVNPHDIFIMNRESVIAHLEGDLLHYSYYTIDEHDKQIDKFSSISSKALFEKGMRSNMLKIYFKPLARFIKGYFIKLGFLDGYYGFLICKKSAYANFQKYKKLFELQKSQNK